MNEENSRRTVIVTGSTSGIGRGIATHLATAGYDVMMNGFGDPDEIEALRTNLESLSARKVGYSPTDVSKVKGIKKLFADTLATLGPVDAVVNNAGIQHVSPIETFPVDKWEQIVAINLSAAFHTTRMAFRSMKERRWGRIVNICSAHGLVASPFKSAYVAAKHGLIGLTKATALEGAEHGIRVNAICPGYVNTDLVKNQISDTSRVRGMSEEKVAQEILLAAQPTKQFVTVEEIAKLTEFLLSSAATSINGAEMKIDGGWTAQ